MAISPPVIEQARAGSVPDRDHLPGAGANACDPRAPAHLPDFPGLPGLRDLPDLPGLREATAADQPLLAALYRASRDDLTRLGDGPALDALIAMQHRVHAEGQRRQYPQARQWLLRSGGRDVAQLLLERGPHRLHLIDIAVLPDARRQGVGRSLLRWAQRQAAVASLPLALNVRRDNHPARRLYLALGFCAVAGIGDEVFEPMRWEAAATGSPAP